MKIAVLSDIHYGPKPSIAARRGDLAAHLLQRAVQRFNRFIKPDYVLLLGDLVDDAGDTAALVELREILAKLDCPYLAIPGNHDPAPDVFYEIMPDPGDQVDFADVRFLRFIDPEEPGYCASRPESALARLRAARSDGFAGVVIALQHVAVMPDGAMATPFRYLNLEAVMEAMAAADVALTIGGHCHLASDIVRDECGAGCLSIGALCEAPHTYTMLTVENGRVSSQVEALAMPAAYGLCDQHSHTQYAYCSQNMEMALSPVLAATMGLRRLVFTEHSGQLYVPRERYWDASFCTDGVDGLGAGCGRMADYLREAALHASGAVGVGLEVDADFRGRPVVLDADRAAVQLVVGAVHFLPADLDAASFVAAFKAATETLCHSEIQILAHPLRIFRRRQQPVPESLYPWLAALLRRTGVAAEINFHTNDPAPAFIRTCLEQEVKLSFGSDAHALWEVGEFYPHLQLLSGLGVSGDPGDHLYRAAV